jgi:SnoaL-like domain
MEAELERYVREQQDRQAIYDCMIRYCRGVDRLDRAFALSAYHAGALDDHGHYVGPAEGLIDSALELHGRLHQRTQHHITNHRCELDGDTAHAESYYLCYMLNRVAPFASLAGGRYIDRLEKRDGRWGIVARVCTLDVLDATMDPMGNVLDGTHRATSRDRNDPSYQRPLIIDPARFTG